MASPVKIWARVSSCSPKSFKAISHYCCSPVTFASAAVMAHSIMPNCVRIWSLAMLKRLMKSLLFIYSKIAKAYSIHRSACRRSRQRYVLDAFLTIRVEWNSILAA